MEVAITMEVAAPTMKAENQESGFLYSQQQKETLDTIEKDAREKFPPSNDYSYTSVKSLREDLIAFAHSRGFGVTTQGSALYCTKAAEPTSYKKQREVREAKYPTDPNKKRKRIFTRCSCNFVIKYTVSKGKGEIPVGYVKINETSKYRHIHLITDRARTISWVVCTHQCGR